MPSTFPEGLLILIRLRGQVALAEYARDNKHAAVSRHLYLKRVADALERWPMRHWMNSILDWSMLELTFAIRADRQPSMARNGFFSYYLNCYLRYGPAPVS